MFNTVTYNHIEYSFGQDGGQIWLGMGSSGSIVRENEVTGLYNYGNPENGCSVPPTGKNYGFEIYGTSQDLYNNGVTTQEVAGLVVDDTNGIEIMGTDPYCTQCTPNKIAGNYGAGIWFDNLDGPITGIVLDTVRVENNGGVGIQFDTSAPVDTGPGFPSGAACLSGNSGGRWTGNDTGLSYKPPANDTGC
ncbi:MAG TPA: hypothetical protein VKV17_14475 [Bryobacteraceae bacterium]|nr:hypothetical protein [Bryobacteraceae bacterium]